MALLCVAFFFLKCIVNTNTWNLKCSTIAGIIDSDDDGIVPIFEHFSNIRCDIFQKRGWSLLN